MIGHLGSRVSALLDGQLTPEEADRAWEHVHACHTCRDQVEREGWVKTRLTGLSFDVAAPCTPDSLKGTLLCAPAFASTPGETYLAGGPDRRRTGVGLAAIGGSAVGAAVMGVLVLGVGPASAPAPNAPATSITQDAPRTPVPSVARRAWSSPDETR